MTNKEKQRYISDLTKRGAIQFKSIFLQTTNFEYKNPKILYKYRKFDEYTFDALDKNYIYFASANKLDDPFECRGYIPEGIVKARYRIDYNKRILKFLLKQFPVKDPVLAQQLEQAFSNAIGPDKIDERKLFDSLPNEAFTDPHLNRVTNALSNIQLKVDGITGDKNIEKYVEASNEGESKMGVFSMSEINNSRIMWSLYSNNYKGYCIEYDFENSPFRNILFPVIYKKRYRNDILNNTVMLNLNVFIERFTGGVTKGDYSFGLIQYLNKDISWKAQKEWRLLYNPDFRADAPKINAIYLGCNVAARNETRMKNYSKKMGFDLYKMKIDPKRNKLSFIKI